jgi:hypothetical protein
MSASDAISYESELDDPTPEEREAEPAGAPWGEDLARRFGWIVMVLAPLVAYSNAFNVPFVFDGFNYIVEKEWIGDIWSGDEAKVKTFFAEAQTRPLVYLSFACDYQNSKFLTTEFPTLAETPTGHYLPVWHVTSLAIHITAGLALYGAARRGFRSAKLGGRFASSAERIALTVALLWVVHPLDTQSVTYLYQRHESLMGMFYFLTLFLFTRFAEGGPFRWGWAALSVSACLCGMASKEVMITAPFVVLWYDWVFVAEPERRWTTMFLRFASAGMELVRRRGVYHLATFATLGMLAYLLSFTYKDYAKAGILDTSRITPQEYALSQIGVVRRYMQLSAVPVGLNIDYAWRKPATWPSTDEFPYIDSWPTNVDWPAIIFPGIFVFGFGFLTLIAIFRSPAIGFLGGTFFLILAPTSSIAPIIDLCFEHRMYVPLASILALEIVLADVALSMLLRRLGRSEATQEAVKTLLVVVIATTFTILTLDRNYDYRSQTALWDDAQRKAPKNERAKYNHGVYLQIEGTKESMDQAIVQYYETLKLDPKYSSAHLNLANIYLYRGELDLAKQHYLALLALEPMHSAGRYGLADTLFRAKLYQDAKTELEKLLVDEPNNGDADKLLKRVLEDMGSALAPTGTAPAGPMPKADPNAT